MAKSKKNNKKLSKKQLKKASGGFGLNLSSPLKSVNSIDLSGSADGGMILR